MQLRKLWWLVGGSAILAVATCALLYQRPYSEELAAVVSGLSKEAVEAKYGAADREREILLHTGMGEYYYFAYRRCVESFGQRDPWPALELEWHLRGGATRHVWLAKVEDRWIAFDGNEHFGVKF